MASHRILIVDDHKESTKVIRTGLESLEQDFQIDDVLSGEEAILEMSHGPIDLLIADVRLPGISGLELMEKFKKKNADTYVILVSGVTDPKIRQEVAQAGAEAFFFKPYDLADFLDSVERILGFVETTLPLELKVEQAEAIDQEKEASGMSRRISELQEELNASAVLLIGVEGDVLVRAGDLPDDGIETSVMPTLATAFNASVRVSQFLEQDTPDNLMSFRGGNYDLFLAPVGEDHCLLVTTKPTLFREMGKIAKAVQTASKAILMSLFNMGATTAASSTGPLSDSESVSTDPTEEEKPVTAPKPDPEAEKETPSSDPKLEKLLAEGKKASKKEADAFWESVPADEIPSSIESKDALSYDQAVQLGLAPSED